MNMAWNILVGVLILVWFIRLGCQMGFNLPVISILERNVNRKRSIYSLFQKRVTYPGEKVTRKEIFTIFTMALLIRLAIYIVSLVIIFINSDASTFTFADFLSNWKRWDAEHYIGIASKGYEGYTENGEHLFLVFFPLYPWFLRIVHLFVDSWEAACLVLSSVSYAVGCCFFYSTLSEEYNKSIAYKSIVLLSVFPFSFFFGAMMTEGLFFCMMSMGFYFTKKHDWYMVGMIGILCALCRVQGVILMGVAGVEFLITYPFFTMYKEKQLMEFWKQVCTKGIFLFLIPIGNLIYFYINYKVTGNPFQFTIYQSEHWYHDTTYFTNCLDEIIANLVNGETSNAMLMSIWLPELILFILIIILLFYGLTRHPLKYTAYLFVYTLINYSVTFVISGGRYMLCAFPLFVIVGELLDRHPKIYQWTVAISAMLMAVYLAGYLEWKQIM